MRNILLIPIVLLVAILAGCGDVRTTDSLEGRWMQTVGESDAITLEGTIIDDTIEIFWTSPDVRGLYWKGTFNTGGVVSEDEIIVSDADRVALDSSLLGSSASTKNFTYRGGKLVLDFTVFGVTQVVELERV